MVFNEGWGQYDTPRLTRWVKQLDPSRLVATPAAGPTARRATSSTCTTTPAPAARPAEPDRAAVLGEFGGLGLAVPGHTWVEKTWGYRGMADPKALTRKYLELWQKAQQLRDTAGLCAAVYTQITDVETECNGLFTYDRKVDQGRPGPGGGGSGPGLFPAAAASPGPGGHGGKRTCSLALHHRAAIRRLVPAGFDVSAWKEGPAGFGTKGTPNVTPRTVWKSGDIWIRREVTLPDVRGRELQLRLYHDDDAEVYLNGVLAGKFAGYGTKYEVAEIAEPAAAAIRTGKNVIAVHCHQVRGGQYIDAGLDVLVQPAAGK